MTSTDEFAAYRRRVDEVAAEVATRGDDPDADPLAGLADDPVIGAVLAHHPRGADAAIEALRRDVRGFVPNGRSSAQDLMGLVRVYLLHQIDVQWWGQHPAYATSADVLNFPDLADLNALRDAGRLHFRYRLQPGTFARRVVSAVRRRVLPQNGPPSAGIRYPRARQAAVALLNEIALEYAARCADNRAAAQAGVWLNSAVRSEAHQDHLRSLGYSALTPSSHCSGHAVDVAVEWLRPSGGDAVLKAILLERQERGEVDVIDEGQAWHVCVAPTIVPRLEAEYRRQMEDSCAESP